MATLTADYPLAPYQPTAISPHRLTVRLTLDAGRPNEQQVTALTDLNPAHLQQDGYLVNFLFRGVATTGVQAIGKIFQLGRSLTFDPVKRNVTLSNPDYDCFWNSPEADGFSSLDAQLRGAGL